MQKRCSVMFSDVMRMLKELLKGTTKTTTTTTGKTMDRREMVA